MMLKQTELIVDISHKTKLVDYLNKDHPLVVDYVKELTDKSKTQQEIIEIMQSNLGKLWEIYQKTSFPKVCDNYKTADHALQDVRKALEEYFNSLERTKELQQKMEL